MSEKGFAQFKEKKPGGKPGLDPLVKRDRRSFVILQGQPEGRP